MVTRLPPTALVIGVTLKQGNRSIAQDMALGHQTQHLAQTYGLTAGRVSQLRRQFHQDWSRFTGDCEAVVA
jgi:hypothetical protein